MQEDDGLGGVRRSGLAQRGAYSADTQIAPAHAFDPLAPGEGPRAPRDAGGDRGAEHVRWAFDHANDRDESTGDGRVVLGPCTQPAQIGVDEAHTHGPRPLDLGQRQVGADRQLPGVIDGNARGAEEAAGQVALAVLEAVAQRHGLGGGHGHSLPVGGVERAHRVARDEQPRREAVQAVVAAADAGREAMGRDVVGRLGGLDRVAGGATVAANAANPSGSFGGRWSGPYPPSPRIQRPSSWANRNSVRG